MTRIMYLREPRSANNAEETIISLVESGMLTPEQADVRYHKYNAVGCIALERDKSEVKYAVTVLHPNERFNRKYGRQYAKGKLIEEARIVEVPETASRHDVTEAVMRDIATDKTLPNRAVKSAKLWLRLCK